MSANYQGPHTEGLGGEASASGSPLMLNVKEVANMFHCSPRTVWRRVQEGALPPPVHFGRLTLWDVGELREAREALKLQRYR